MRICQTHSSQLALPKTHFHWWVEWVEEVVQEEAAQILCLLVAAVVLKLEVEVEELAELVMLELVVEVAQKEEEALKGAEEELDQMVCDPLVEEAVAFCQ